MTSSRFNVRTLVPSDLSGLSEDEFRLVVDADLRRRVNPGGLPERVSMALRAPENLNRWLAVLVRMARSVDGQSVAAQDEYNAQIGSINSAIRRLEDHDKASPQLVALYEQIDAKRTEYLTKKASRERFRTGLEEHIVLAESLLAAQRDEMYESIVVIERDRYARRVRELERAIRDHHEAVAEHLQDEEPFEFDVTLWAALGGET